MTKPRLDRAAEFRGIRPVLRRGIATLALAVACLSGLAVASSTTASAMPCNPRSCPTDPPLPRPPSPTYTVDARPLDLLPGTSQPVAKYNAEHVATTVHVRYQIQRSTGATLNAWVVSDYHVWNDYAFQGWHVTVHENLYNAASSQQQVWTTNNQIIGVTGTVFGGSDVWASYAMPIPISTAQGLYQMQAVDTFSN